MEKNSNDRMILQLKYQIEEKKGKLQKAKKFEPVKIKEKVFDRLKHIKEAMFLKKDKK